LVEVEWVFGRIVEDWEKVDRRIVDQENSRWYRLLHYVIGLPNMGKEMIGLYYSQYRFLLVGQDGDIARCSAVDERLGSLDWRSSFSMS
jgi:hypothetical protein